ncbi:MAG: hypothetical protein KDB58_13210 [Solirubrobacterales bacterium]|nr:hypothetical protein [Solirubrobacterales bacterium]MCB8969901.1 hypothetical protein [Thermoleophilales bacterium]MCO5327442.1 hypothetical protein [Solirubrobacterales bacterium]
MTPTLLLAHHTLGHASEQFAIYFGPVIVLVIVLVIASKRHARTSGEEGLIELEDEGDEAGEETVTAGSGGATSARGGS